MITGALSGQPVVHIQMNKAGAVEWAAITRQNIGRTVAVILDSRILMIPLVRDTIAGGSLEITGPFTPEELKILACMLNAGRLPMKLVISGELAIKGK